MCVIEGTHWVSMSVALRVRDLIRARRSWAWKGISFHSRLTLAHSPRALPGHPTPELFHSLLSGLLPDPHSES